MTEVHYQLTRLLECRHRAYHLGWPAGVSFAPAPDCADAFGAPYYRFLWRDRALHAATCRDTSQIDRQLCLWARGADPRFWLSTALLEASAGGAAQIAVGRITQEGGVSFGNVAPRPLRFHLGAGSSIEVHPLGCAAQRVEVDADGHIDLSTLGPGLYRLGSRGSWFYASDRAYVQPPPLAVIFSPSELAARFADAQPAQLCLEGPALFWRYFVFAERWDDDWTLESERTDVSFTRLTGATAADAFAIAHDGARPMLQFAGGQRALGFISARALELHARPELHLVQAGTERRVALPRPCLNPSTLSRTTDGARQALCVDTFVHL